MNTVKSVYYGWGSLILAGGGAYYFAKKSINADRAAKAAADREKRLAQHQLEQSYLYKPAQTQTTSPTSKALSGPISSTPSIGRPGAGGPTGTGRAEAKDAGGNGDWGDEAGNPSGEASKDPAPTRHAPEDEAQKMREKSKYEASDVFRSRKGDRFS
ncbi:hypothetical protein P154DRAFT_537533 [Amniculicola lignicola CBS 123094]|uniref:Uncharacterized protein n=1 Tax=Amniculicola lignicola CBS 123094 TaxID=1392246 RepID=A0A6A5W829_9PLEO|nr:hypothetical protein P154DRAFT_537533 [Amniculicola lignicola CBS 123094]